MFSVRIENEMPYFSLEYYEHLAIQEIVKIIEEKSNNKKIKIYKLINHIKSNNDTRIVRFYSNLEL
ncbi:MAG: hypothetical protein M0R46_17430 [Candidatus Muirbacterium halophilum]|nr:hypothetical protein [Candidatus Muirbacterium halophilum]